VLLNNFTIDLMAQFQSGKTTQSFEELWFPAATLKPEEILPSIQEPWRKANGLHVLRKGAKTIIHTDNFGTVPLLFDTKSKRIASDFRQMSPFDMSFQKIDVVAFWEGMVYDYALQTRTMNKDVIQIPGGSRLEFDCISGQWSLKRWNYFDVPGSCDCEDKLLTVIDERLESLCRYYWSMLPDDGYILLPLSGGLDSRLLAIYFARTGDPARITAVTFGFSRRSQEFRIARKVCEKLGINRHLFHQLPRDRYALHSTEFWRNWQGCLSVMHSHLYSFLHEHQPEKSLLVTGFFADPIAGYAAEPVLNSIPSIESSTAYKRLHATIEEMQLGDKIADSIRVDISHIFDEWQQTNPRFGFDEYLYLSQRQSKSYSPLLQMYRSNCMVVAPYSDPDLVKLFLSAPFNLRKDKLIMRKLIAIGNEHLAKISDVSSSITTNSLLYYLRAEWRKWCSRSTLIWNWATNDRLRYVSSYSTEDIKGALRSECRTDILAALEEFKKVGILTKYQRDVLRKKPLRSREVARIAQILTFSPWIKAQAAKKDN